MKAETVTKTYVWDKKDCKSQPEGFKSNPIINVTIHTPAYVSNRQQKINRIYDILTRNEGRVML